MARTVKSAARKQERVAAEVTARMLLEVTDDTPVYYVNYAEVTHSAHDFALLLGRTPAKPDAMQIEELQETGDIRTEAMLQILLPTTILPGLMRALTLQREHYEARFGPIRDTGVEDAE